PQVVVAVRWRCAAVYPSFLPGRGSQLSTAKTYARAHASSLLGRAAQRTKQAEKSCRVLPHSGTRDQQRVCKQRQHQLGKESCTANTTSARPERYI
uniref:Uncharacterized protein n=1 Tax=Anopheles arabiensis TaxID=7173 RepID=A0A182I9J7_ANOAR